MYYYGARYYKSRLSLWVSTDPLGETAPHITVYCYTANNPTILIDPDGKAWKPTKNEETDRIQDMNGKIRQNRMIPKGNYF